MVKTGMMKLFIVRISKDIRVSGNNILDDAVGKFEHLELPDVCEFFLSFVCDLCVDLGLPTKKLQHFVSTFDVRL